MENEKLLYAPNRAAKILDISRSTLYGLMKAGKIGFVMIGNDRRITSSELQRIASEGVPAPATQE